MGQVNASDGDGPHGRAERHRSGSPEQTSLTSWAVILLGLIAAAAFCLFSSVHLLATPETCHGRRMGVDDTCRHYGRGSERLQAPTTTTVTLPQRPKLPPGMGDDVPDIWAHLPSSITATVPAADGHSRGEQVWWNRISGTFGTIFGAGLLVTGIVLGVLTIRRDRRSKN